MKELTQEEMLEVNGGYRDDHNAREHEHEDPNNGHGKHDKWEGERHSGGWGA